MFLILNHIIMGVLIKVIKISLAPISWSYFKVFDDGKVRQLLSNVMAANRISAEQHGEVSDELTIELGGFASFFFGDF